MSSPVISVQNVGKTFLLNQDPGAMLSAKISRWLNPANWGTTTRQPPGLLRALDDVSFDVQEGDVLGLIGRNGAGKSTLLKIISQVTRPTQGRVLVRGSMGSLLEVGTGFHSELTGRENIFLNGAIIGMSRSDIKNSFDQIVEFAGTGDFLDTQLKHYSSGMQTRLAFSISAHLNARILILDETLSVGDFIFQKKCLDKIRSLSQSDRTIVLVSHNMSIVLSTCNKCALLEKGKLTQFGTPPDLVKHYQRTGVSTESEFWNRDHSFRLFDFGFVAGNGDRLPAVENFQPVRLAFKVELKRPFRYVSFMVFIDDKNLNRIAALDSRLTEQWFDFQPGIHSIGVDIGQLPLAPGDYNSKLKVVDENGEVLFVESGPGISIESGGIAARQKSHRIDWHGHTVLQQEWNTTEGSS